MMFSPRLALASLSGESDASWAEAGASYAGAAFLGGIAICAETRAAARVMVARERTEFLPADPVEFIERQLATLEHTAIRPGVNVRTIDPSRLKEVAEVCAASDAILELNAHCRQAEMCDVGAGETLLAQTERLAQFVDTATTHGADVGVKVRAEVPGVDLVDTAKAIESAGGAAIHVDAMDSPHVISTIADETNLFVIANNGVRGTPSTRQYLRQGAAAVSVGRPSDRPDILRSVHSAVIDWFGGDGRATIDRKRSTR